VDGRRVAVHTRTSASAPSTVYLLQDHQGGVDGFTSASGALLSRSSYQPFGARRSGDWLSGTPTSVEWQQIRATTPRGYTGQEHLDNLGIIHMDGRVYDPALGRFLSPDPILQSPYDTQGLNRYAYVRNNQLAVFRGAFRRRSGRSELPGADRRRVEQVAPVRLLAGAAVATVRARRRHHRFMGRPRGSVRWRCRARRRCRA
jgi:RHS repeat-associated protein